MSIIATHSGSGVFCRDCTSRFRRLFAAVVKTKIERYREMQRHSQHDSLTGLLNHSAAKSRLNLLVQSLQNT
ncbi:MAG: hypothetical protein K8F32_13145, partial [Rhodocyclaceae bacterium]|nr:hypothetical protein [Rhodocyclaceae bacterium]